MGALQDAAASLLAAERLLKQARRDYPNKGRDPVRAVIDVSLGDLRGISRHVVSAALAEAGLPATHPEIPS